MTPLETIGEAQLLAHKGQQMMARAFADLRKRSFARLFRQGGDRQIPNPWSSTP